MGTLVAFIVVSIGVIVLRRTRPDLPRSFRVPGYPVTPILSILACLYLITGLGLSTYVVVRGLGGGRARVLPAVGQAPQSARGARPRRRDRDERVRSAGP